MTKTEEGGRSLTVSFKFFLKTLLITEIPPNTDQKIFFLVSCDVNNFNYI